MSEATEKKDSVVPPPVRIRSRMRAAPNVAISSGLARTRRLSGHFTAAEKTVQSSETAQESEKSNQNQPLRSRSPSISQSRSPSKHTNMNENSRETIMNTQINSIQLNSVLKPKSPAHELHTQILKPRMPFISKINEDGAKSPNIGQSNQSVSNLSFRQYINYQSNVLKQQSNVNLVPLSPSVSLNHPPTPNIMPCTPGGTEYNPKFSDEHIMNIIKHKSMQKLKKIEAESLKEKRKSYQNSLNSLDSNRTALDNESTDPGNIPIDRSKTRMRDLLYYNAKNKKSDPNETILNASVTSPQASDQSASLSPTPDSSMNAEQHANEIEARKKKEQLLNSAPQLKFADDGSIIINEASLIIEREEQAPVYDNTVIESEQIDNLTYISYRKFHHTKKWTERETAKFYKALGMIGTDFTMIQKLFSHRSRDEIKRKFKREEKLNQALIDKIMSKTSEIDLSVFVSASSDDERKKKSNEIKPAKVQKKRISKEKSPNEPKAKLKRVQKRAFIESESDEDSHESNKSQTNTENSSQSSSGAIQITPPLHQSLVSAVEIQSIDTPTNIEQTKNTQSSDDDSDNEELVLDLDNNTITSQKSVFNITYDINSHNLINANEHSATQIQIAETLPVKAAENSIPEANSTEPEDTVILDLDNNQIVSGTSTTYVNYKPEESAVGNPNNPPKRVSRSRIIVAPNLNLKKK